MNNLYSIVIPTVCRKSARRLKGFADGEVTVGRTVMSLIRGGVPPGSIHLRHAFLSEDDSPEHKQQLYLLLAEGVSISFGASAGMYADAIAALRGCNWQAQYVVFMEDDVLATSDFHGKITYWLEKHRPTAATFANWGNYPDGAIIPQDKFWGIQCFAMERRLIEKMPETAFAPPEELHDRTWAITLDKLGFKIHVGAPSLVQHVGGDTSTRTGVSNYEHRLSDFVS